MKKAVSQRTLYILVLAVLFHISVDGCPTNCTCMLDNHVDCQHGHLTNIPTDIPRGTVYLQLQYNRIHYLAPNAFQASLLRTLRKLVLSHNELGSIHPDAFRTHIQDNALEILDLSYNNLSSILPHTFDKLHRLQHLYLQRNNLPMITSDTFPGLQSLQVLNLQDNMISVIARGSFQYLPSLLDLSLQNNQLTRLQDNTFDGLTNLQTLDLSRNRIFRVDRHAFIGMNNISDLRLDFNRLAAIPEFPEAWFPRNCLKRLNLSHNPIETITDHALGLAIELKELYLHDLPELLSVQKFAFRGLPKLQQLHMYNNPNLRTLPVNVLAGLQRIRQIDLHNNSIKAINVGLFPESWELHAVDLSDNPWDCSCDNAQFRRWLARFDSHGSVLNQERTLCKYPPQSEGDAFLSMSAEDDCSDGEDSEEEEEEDDEREKDKKEEYRSRGEPEPEPDLPEVPCTHNVCLQNGACKIQGDQALCRCPRPYRGKYCEYYGDKGKLEDISAVSHTETSIDISWEMKQVDEPTTLLVYWSVNGPMQYEVSEDLPRTRTSYRVEGLHPGSFHRVCVHSSRYNFRISHQCEELGTLGFSGEEPSWGDDPWPDHPDDKPDPMSGSDPLKLGNIGKALGIGGGVVVIIAIAFGVACRLRYLRRRANAEAETPPPEYSRTAPRESQIQLQDLPPPYHEVVGQGYVNPALQGTGTELQQRDNRSSAHSLPTISEEHEGAADTEQHK